MRLILSIPLLCLCAAPLEAQTAKYSLSHRSDPKGGAQVTLIEKSGGHRRTYCLGRIGDSDWGEYHDWVVVRGQTMVGGLFNRWALNAYEDELMLVVYDLTTRKHAFDNEEPYYWVRKKSFHIFEDGSVFGIVRFINREPEWFHYDRKSGITIKPIPQKYQSTPIEFRGLDGRPRFRLGEVQYLLRNLSFQGNEWRMGLEKLGNR